LLTPPTAKIHAAKTERDALAQKSAAAAAKAAAAHDSHAALQGERAHFLSVHPLSVVVLAC
jgi:hypothetical protein